MRGAATIALSVAIGIGILSFSPAESIGPSNSPSEAWTTVRNGVASIQGFLTGKSDAVPASSPLNVQAAGLPNSNAGLATPTDNDSEIDTVIVQPGEKLRQVILRTMGEYTRQQSSRFRG